MNMGKKRNSRALWTARQKRVTATIDQRKKKKKLFQKIFALVVFGIISGITLIAIASFIF